MFFFFIRFCFSSNWQLVNCKEKSRQKKPKKSLYEKCKKIDRLKWICYSNIVERENEIK